MKKIIIWLFLIGVVAAAGVYFYHFHIAAKHDDPLEADNMVTISSKDLYTMFSQYEDSANKLYNGKVIKVSGVVGTVELDKNRYTINYENGDEMGTVICEMDTMENETVKGIKPGSKATVAGFCNGINMDVYIDRCKLAN